MTTHYDEEILSEEIDAGDMARSRNDLAKGVVGHKIVNAERAGTLFRITLDTGRVVELRETDDCCAYTQLNDFLLHVDRVDHIITGVGTTGEFENWHIYADMGDVLELEVGWSAGNVGYYGYGFDIRVTDA